MKTQNYKCGQYCYGLEYKGTGSVYIFSSLKLIVTCIYTLAKYGITLVDSEGI